MTESSVYIGIVVVTLIILLLVASIVISVFISNRQRLKQEMNLSEMKLSYEKELRNADHEIREQLMSYLSRELHDHVGHTLLNMQLIIENRKLDDPEGYKNLMPFENLLQEASDQLRHLSRSLNQEYLSRLSFQEAINKEMERLSEFSAMEVKYIPGTVRYGTLDRDQLLMSYRIFQEVINNIIRHSEATTFTVRSNSQDFLLKVEDNGKGFQAEAMLASDKASGLRNMKKRAALAGLQLEIHSAKGSGTTITLSIPKTTENEQ